jgi:tetratricopeptide (TPR) repeat protein
MAAPDTIDECLAVGAELAELAQRNGDRERVANALDHIRTALVFAGRLEEAAANLDREAAIAETLRQPVQLWQTHTSRAMLALTAGRLAEAEELIPKALASREQAFPQVAIPVYRLQRATLFEFRGRLGEVLPDLVALVADYPTRPMFRCALAHAHARVGHADDARAALGEMSADGVAALPFDQEWLLGMAFLAESAAILDDTAAQATLYDALLPWAALNTGDHPEGIRGSAARYLGLIAPSPEQAAEHFEDALAMNERMGARPWLAYTQTDCARLVPGREALQDAALATYEELGMEPVRLVSPSGR